MPLQFGTFELDLNAGQVRKSGVLLKLRPQAFRILTLLASRAGQVVTRDEIQKEIWSNDTVVDFDQGLNFCIRQIRAVLGDDADSPRFIETIPRRGYRFLVPVAGNGGAPAAVASEAPQTAAPRHWRWIAAAAAVAVAALALWSFRPRPAPSAWRAVPLTSYPGFERHPALSPDGKQVAFTWDGEKRNFDIYVKTIGAGAPMRLTTNPAEDASPAWSPHGHTIGFVRHLGADRGELLLIPALGGPERKLAETRGEFRNDLPSLAWSPDGRWLAVSHREPADLANGLFLVSAQTGDKRRLTGAPRGFVGDYTPAFSPDGRSLAFVRLSGWVAGEIYRLPLSGEFSAAGEPQRLTTDGRLASSPVWTRDGRHIAYVFAQADREGPRELRIIAASGSRRAERVPLLEEDISELSLGRHLVYSRGTGDSNIWRAEIRPHGFPLSVPQRWIASTRRDGLPRYSPDGKKIAFGSTRSGSREIWIAEADGSNPVQLTSFGGPQVGVKAWSPDSQRLVFHVRAEGQADLFTIPATGGAPRRLTTDPSDDVTPSYSHDGRWIYFSSIRSGRWEIWKMPAEGGEATQITRSEGSYMPMESPDGKALYYCHKLPEKGIWKMPIQGGEGVQVTGPYSPPMCALAVTAGGLYYTAAPDSRNQHSIQFVSFSTGQSRPVVVSDRPFGSLSLSVSPDDCFVLYVHADQSGRDLMLIENFAVQ